MINKKNKHVAVIISVLVVIDADITLNSGNFSYNRMNTFLGQIMFYS